MKPAPPAAYDALPSDELFELPARSARRGRTPARGSPTTELLRWASFLLASGALAVAVLLRGGVDPRQWQWCALAIALAAAIIAAATPVKLRARWNRVDRIGVLLLAALAGWMILPLVPLPLEAIRHLSPRRWGALMGAAGLGGEPGRRWAPLSLAPAATVERLLDILPAMAAFLMAREFGWWRRGTMWIAAAPVVAIAFGQSLLGCAQFLLMRSSGGDAGSATGTYVNRNHFAGLLEMALPLACLALAAAWERRSEAESVAQSLRILALAGVATSLFAGIVVSLSRAGFVSAVAALGTAVLVWMRGRVGVQERARWRPWKWIVALAALVCLLVAAPTQELQKRFFLTPTGEGVKSDTRMAIWRDTAHLIASSKWTGAGAGAFERGLYAYKTAKPTNTVDFAHNDYLQIVAEFGIPGAALIAASMLWIGWRCAEGAFLRREGRNWELAVGLLGALAAIALHSVTDFNLYIPANALALAWLAGLAVSPALREA